MGIEQIRLMKEQALLPKEKKRYVIPKISEKKKKQILDESGRFKEDKEMEDWYREMRCEDSGVCEELGCNNPTFKFDNKKFKWSIAHIIPKEHFSSVKTHPYNRIFLCWQHHSVYDQSWESAKKLNCWELAKERFEFFRKQIKETHKILDNFN